MANKVQATTQPDQFTVYDIPVGVTGKSWDEQYVSFSGYFGVHGPHVYNAGPDLLIALRGLLDAIKDAAILDSEEAGKAFAAIAKAEGRSND